MEVALIILALGLVVVSIMGIFYEPESGKVTAEEMGELVGQISDAIGKGIRTSLGLDLAAEIIPPEQEDTRPALLKELEQDPFMEEEWLGSGLPQTPEA